VVQTKVIGEIAVLAIDIGVVGIVEGGFVVGWEKGNAMVQHLFQGGSATTINVFIEHDSVVFVDLLTQRYKNSMESFFLFLGSFGLIQKNQKIKAQKLLDRRACQRRTQPYSLQAVLVVVFKGLLQVSHVGLITKLFLIPQNTRCF
jgi:hypothetical protein